MSQPKVILYMDPGCPHCRHVKQYLDQRGVAYPARDVTSDPAAVEDLQKMTAPGVPVTVIDGQRVIGFDKVRLDDLLKARDLTVGQPG